MYFFKKSFCCIIVLDIFIDPGLLRKEGGSIVTIQQWISQCHLHVCTNIIMTPVHVPYMTGH